MQHIYVAAESGPSQVGSAAVIQRLRQCRYRSRLDSTHRPLPPGQTAKSERSATMARGMAVCIFLFFAAASTLATTPQKSAKLTNTDVVEMVGMGLSDDVVVDKIHSADATEFDTSLEALKTLKASKVSDAVLRVMINPHPGSSPIVETARSVPPADPNDPNSTHDPGIYMYVKGKNGLELVMLEPTVYSQGKSGGVFKSAMTYGIAKVKWKAVVRGAHANVRSSDGNMAFYFYFEESNAGLSHASFGGTTTPNAFTLLKFDEKKDARETIAMQRNALGASSGTDEKANTGFDFTKLRPGVYKVVPKTPLKPGEYCFLSSSGVGAYGAGSAGASRLFDFAVLAGQ